MKKRSKKFKSQYTKRGRIKGFKKGSFFSNWSKEQN